MTDKKKYRRFRLPREWSNTQLRNLGSVFSGDVVNVSGWRDEDKQGGYYKNYFPHAASYRITNYSGKSGHQGGDDEIFLDLASDLPAEMTGMFDVVFNHTTLEHIFDVRKAFDNLCSMSRDIVIIVVPLSQEQHETESFGDFWRFMPGSVRQMFAVNKMTVIYEAVNEDFNAGVYLIAVGSKYPDRWLQKMPAFKSIKNAGKNIGLDAFSALKRLIRSL